MATADPFSVARPADPYRDALVWGSRWDQSSGPITYDILHDAGSQPWSAGEAAAARAALQSWSEVAAVQLVERDNEITNLNLLLADLADLGPGVLGVAIPPDGTDYDGLIVLDPVAHPDWLGQLQPGGYSFITLVHEIGHALGLAHPHDHGGASGLFPGVAYDVPSDTGTYGLNTQLFTVMSYNGAGQARAPRAPASYGLPMGPMAFDIAAIQWIYGANLTTRTGADTYLLPTANVAGTGYRCIWDPGGTDRIAHTGSAACRIDLREASLAGPNAGGYLSRVDGVLGGFTIAQGVLIERADGGSGNDLLIGNAAGNLLMGRAGADSLVGLDGDDTLAGGSGPDLLFGGSGFDLATYVASAVAVTVRLTGISAGGDATGDRYASIETVRGSELADHLLGSAAGNTLLGGAGSDTLFGFDGGDRLRGGDDGDSVYGGNGNDTVDGGAGVDRLDGGAENDLLLGGDADDVALGGLGDDRLFGGDGLDLLYGGDGVDRVYGGAGPGRLFGGNDTDLLYGDLDADTVLGGAGNDHLYGRAGTDLLLGDDGTDRLHGEDGADRLRGGAGDDTLFGGNGDDIAYFAGMRADYSISGTVGGVVTVADLAPLTGGDDGIDRLFAVELLRFTDGTVRLADIPLP